jgi:SAM-dependent methyltransferase
VTDWREGRQVGGRGAADPFTRIPDHYRRLITEYGHDPRACDWGGPEAQRVRYRVLADVADLDGCRVLDVGCGFADWAAFLEREVGTVDYSGVEITTSMAAEAKRLRPDLRVRVANFLDDDVGGDFDVVAANGIFYLLGEDAPRLMRMIIAKMFGMARVAVAFTTLSAWARDPAPGEFYADPLETLDYCRSLTPWVTLRHDYHPRDFAVYMYRERRP